MTQIRQVPVKPSTAAMLFALFLPTGVFAWNPDNYWLELRRLNDASRLELQHAQRQALPEGRDTQSAGKRAQKREMDQQQRMAQELLQERQRRRMLILNQRQRTAPPSPNERLKYNGLQLRNLREQDFQLNRFRLQQQWLRRP